MGKPGVNVESDLSSGSFALWFRKQGKRMLAPHNILGLVLLLILAYLVLAPFGRFSRPLSLGTTDMRIRVRMCGGRVHHVSLAQGTGE